MALRSVLCAVLVLAFSLAVQAADPGPTTAAPAGAITRSDYTLQPSDLLQVDVFQEPDLQRQVRISQEATITLPLIGTISVKGLNVRQAQQLIATLYNKSYLVNPQINITVLEYTKRMINVLGSVNTPGAVEIPPEQTLNLLDAIARAGGFSRLADRKRVKLTRTDADGKTVNYIINADDIISGTSSDRWTMRKDDVIFVPERIL